jgi:hypothetical protein
MRELSPAEQRRLRDELASMVGVQLMRPTTTPTAIRHGRLARAVRSELARATKGSLDDTMRNLRGRAWS